MRTLNMAKRIEKVNSLLEQEIGKIILREFYFPEVMVTLTRADCSANLFESKIRLLPNIYKYNFISCYPDKKIDEIVKTLNKNVARIQHEINRKLRMRPVPKIKFAKDKEMSKVGRVEELLCQLKKDEK